jgi:hypothetical protein
MGWQAPYDGPFLAQVWLLGNHFGARNEMAHTSWRIETGHRRLTIENLAALARALDMTVDEVSFIRITDGRISGMWGLEDTWTRIRQLAGDDVTLGQLGSLG